MFAIVTLACAFGNLTQTVMNSMLGGVQQTFGTPEDVSQWLTTIYMLTIGIVVPLATHLSKRYAIRTLILLSLASSLIGALMAAFAPAYWILLTARIIQAIGTGLTLPLIQTIAMTRFPPGQNATAMGVAGIAMGFAPNIGPLIGGALVNTLGWRSFFWMFACAMVVLGAATIVLVRSHDRDAHPANLDFLSFLLSTLGFGGLLLSFSNLANDSILNPAVFAPLVVGAVSLVLFVIRQKRIKYPLITMRIFHSKTYVVSFVAQNLLFASFMGITLIMPLFVIGVSGLTPFDAGLVFLPVTVLAIIVNPVSGILCDKLGARPVVICASVFLTVGAASMAFMNETTPLWVMMVLQSIRGIGVSSLIGPLNSWGLSRLEPKTIIDGTAFFTTARQACASLGTALMMTLIAVAGATALTGAEAVPGFQLALGLSAIFSLAVMLCAIFFIRDLDS